ncbi:hypothetical protein F8O08_10760 [Pseudoclavibacter sp. CFCC 13611]|nr:hypothetical protein F8O08_10760 [Pseudoclavibacter sp. CFCC 13611]
MHVYVTRPDGTTAGYSALNGTPTTANLPRPDVNNAFTITGNHGYNFQIPITQTGTYKVCTYAIGTNWRNTGNNPQIGCKVINTGTAAAPRGSFDELSLTSSNALTIRGWAYDPATSGTSIPVHVYVTRPDGTTAGYSALNGTPTTANLPRPDVNNAFTITGNHGYNFQIPITQTGTYKVCTYAIGTNWRNTGNNPQIGCKVTAKEQIS